jgi:hypothetical protein
MKFRQDSNGQDSNEMKCNVWAKERKNEDTMTRRWKKEKLTENRREQTGHAWAVVCANSRGQSAFRIGVPKSRGGAVVQ